MTKAETYKIRYAIYRDLGYSAKEARALRSKTLDVSPVRIQQSEVKKGPAYRSIRDSMTGPKDIDKFRNKIQRTRNDTVYTKWGMFTRDPRYRDQTARFVKFLEKEHNLTSDQAYTFLYFLTKNRMTYRQGKEEILAQTDFEVNISPKGKPKR